MLEGRCRCDAVRYVVRDAFRYAANCHCSGCRAATGSAFKPFAGIEREKLEITQGLDDLVIFGEEDANDTRCRLCGSFLFSVVRSGEYVHLPDGLARFVGTALRAFAPQFDEHAVSPA